MNETNYGPPFYAELPPNTDLEYMNNCNHKYNTRALFLDGKWWLICHTCPMIGTITDGGWYFKDEISSESSDQTRF